MQNNIFLKELIDHIGKETKLVLENPSTKDGREYAYGIIIEVDEKNLVIRTKWGLRQIYLEKIREVQDTKLNYEDGRLR